MTREDLIQYAKLREQQAKASMSIKPTQTEKDRYFDLSKKLGISPSELTRQSMFKSLYYFSG